ncbi:MAG: peptidyl-prolyl cis-trans isomerase [Opitutales bacterium]
MTVQVNGVLISDAAIEQEAQAIKEEMAKTQSERLNTAPEHLVRLRLREMASRRLIDAELLRQEAGRRDQPVDSDRVQQALDRIVAQRFSGHLPQDEAQREKIREEAQANERIRLIFEEIEAACEEPTEEEAKKFYEDRPEAFKQPEKVRAAHIVAHGSEQDPDAMERAREKIEKAKAALENGESFSSVVERFSDCPNNDGDLGEFQKGHMVERFDAVVFNMQPGEISEPFVTEFGWHIARLDDRTEGETISFEEAKPRILAFLKDHAKHKDFEAFVETLRKSAAIEES